MTKITPEFILEEMEKTEQEKRLDYLSRLLNLHRTQVIQEVWEAEFMKNQCNTVARFKLLEMIK